MTRRSFLAGLVILLAVAGVVGWRLTRPMMVRELHVNARTYGYGTSPSPSPSTAASPSPSPSASATPSSSVLAIWRPKVGVSWQWQLSGNLDTSIVADVYDVDGVETTAAQVATLHQAGRHVICYFNAGAYESFRPDALQYSALLMGKSNGWPGEKWVDVRRWDLLGPVLTARMKACKDKGFDGVEPDNVDGYENDTGFPLTANDQLTFNRHLASVAHSLGLSVALKNDVDQAQALQPDFDYSVDEQCFEYNECNELSVFVSAGKPVFHVEYNLAPSRFCTKAKALHFSSLYKHLELDAWRQAC